MKAVSIKKVEAIIVSTLLIITSLFTFSNVAQANETNPQEEATTLLAVETYTPGNYYLGDFGFTDYNWGRERQYNANQMRVKPAWRATDSRTSEVDLLVKVKRVGGSVVFSKRFTPNDDVDGKDGVGLWYAESSWFNITKGATYQIYYEAFTASGYKPTGNKRKAYVHTWIELRN